MSALIGSLTVAQVALTCGAAVLGGVVFGIAGFAFGVVASVFLHQVFDAADVVFIVACGAVLLNLGLLPRFWRNIDLRRVFPVLLGTLAGLPFGFLLLRGLPPATVHVLVALLLIGYCLYALRRQTQAALPASARLPLGPALVVGFCAGVVGGVSGLGPLVPAVWFGLRGLDKREQRALMQPFSLTVQSVVVVMLLATGTVGTAAVQATLLAMPIMVAAAWLGLRLYDVMSLAHFQRVVIVFALVGAAGLLIR